MEERYVTSTSIPAQAVIAWADAAWAESQAGGAKLGSSARGEIAPSRLRTLIVIGPQNSRLITIPGLTFLPSPRIIGMKLELRPGGAGISGRAIHQPRQTGKVMTEQTSDASASSAPSPSDSIIAAAKAAQGASQAPSLVATDSSPPVAEVVVSAPSPSDLSIIFARLQNIEASLHEHFGPRLEAVEDAIESLAKRATSEASPAISSDLEELQHAVHSLGGGLIGHTGHDAGAFFHSWWKKIAGGEAPTSAPIPPPVVNPLANNGASIPLSGK